MNPTRIDPIKESAWRIRFDPIEGRGVLLRHIAAIGTAYRTDLRHQRSSG